MPVQSVELCQCQTSPRKDVAAPSLDTSQHMSYHAGGYNNQDLQWAGQPRCSDSLSSESSSTDEDQQMQKMLCCPITKVTSQLRCSYPCPRLVKGTVCLNIVLSRILACLTAVTAFFCMMWSCRHVVLTFVVLVCRSRLWIQ